MSRLIREIIVEPSGPMSTPCHEGMFHLCTKFVNIGSIELLDFFEEGLQSTIVRFVILLLRCLLIKHLLLGLNGLLVRVYQILQGGDRLLVCSVLGLQGLDLVSHRLEVTGNLGDKLRQVESGLIGSHGDCLLSSWSLEDRSDGTASTSGR
jgi:hypothetical protein